MACSTSTMSHNTYENEDKQLQDTALLMKRGSPHQIPGCAASGRCQRFPLGPQLGIGCGGLQACLLWRQ